MRPGTVGTTRDVAHRSLLQVVSAAAVAAALVVCALPARMQAQVTPERGAAALGSTLAGIGTTGRVLTVAAHPDDEDTPVIAWLARGRHVETAYLSLTRGDGGQNLIGNELGEALGAIRTQELLSARRIDGGRQYFTRAYDFGFSKNAEETYEHWPKDSILGDVVRVVRAFRPHVIVAFFSGTPRDGHGHHQVSGLLAREAYELAGDTVRYPVQEFGLPWTPSKFYRSARQVPDSATLRINTGEYDPLLGRSYYEVSAESRSQHKSQGFGVLQRKGVMYAYLSREASRVGPDDARSERSLFDGVDTTWAPLRGQLPASAQPLLDSALAGTAAVRAAYRAQDPSTIVEPLAEVLRQWRALRNASGRGVPLLITSQPGRPSRLGPRNAQEARPALWDALSVTVERTEEALALAAGVALEATATQATLPVREAVKVEVNDSLPVTVRLFNRGRVPVQVNFTSVVGLGMPSAFVRSGGVLAPDSAFTASLWAAAFASDSPWWRAYGRKGMDWFQAPYRCP
ncbi:PIG-L family deacetylase [Gemmatimonas sp. UBA7669]|uniref:PIG-L family deacetylase n=1 Tax=Gemmatimonas sp. UBA7669 TaxID=1946568 RepID=UPI0025C1FFB8|nr:PIG-L family deacetylase [Gemmatimonas sp. UBA7669]